MNLRPLRWVTLKMPRSGFRRCQEVGGHGLSSCFWITLHQRIKYGFVLLQRWENSLLNNKAVIATTETTLYTERQSHSRATVCAIAVFSASAAMSVWNSRSIAHFRSTVQFHHRLETTQTNARVPHRKYGPRPEHISRALGLSISRISKGPIPLSTGEWKLMTLHA